MQIEPGDKAGSLAPITAIRKQKVLARTGLSNTQLYRLIRQGNFPPPHKLSERVCVWSEKEISDWLTAKFSSVKEA